MESCTTGRGCAIIRSMSMGVKLAILAVTAAVWSLTMFRLLEDEVFVYWDFQETPTYRTILRDRTKTEIRTMSIFQGEKKVGSIESRIIPRKDGTSVISTESSITVDLPIGRAPRIAMTSVSRIDREYRIIDFHAHLRIAGLAGAELVGKRKEGGLEVSARTPIGSWVSVVPYEMEETISDGFLPIFSAPHLSIGKKWRIKTVEADPTSGGFSYVTLWASVELKDFQAWNDKLVEAYLVEIRRNLGDENPLYTLMIDEEGMILSQEMNILGSRFRVLLDDRRFVDPEESEEWRRAEQ